MNSSRQSSILLHLLVMCVCVAALAVDFQPARSAFDSLQQSTFEKREAAYRANNIGVALLEQFKLREAAESFKQALDLKPDLLMARLNLAIALYYLPDTDGAKQQAEQVLKTEPGQAQAHYLLGLIARGQNRLDDAVAEFQKVLTIDPEDAATNINVGQILTQQKKPNEAIAAFRKAVAAEPYNETALYNLGLLLTRSGKREEGQKLIQKFQQLKANGAGVSLGTNYLEGGRYAEAVVSTGSERELVDKNLPDVKFRLVESIFPTRGARRDQPLVERPAWTYEPGNILAQQFQISPMIFDYDNDGDFDALELNGAGIRLLRNGGGHFDDVTAQAGSLGEMVPAVPVSAVGGDYDNDGRADVLIVRNGRLSLYHNEGEGRFADVTKVAQIPAYPYLAISAAFVDVDHDGDLDIFIPGFADVRKVKVEPLPGKDGPLNQAGLNPSANAGPFQSINAEPGAPNLLLRNNGNGTFTDITANAKVTGGNGHAIAVVATDFDNRRDIDLVVINYNGAIDMFRNQRDGSFLNVASEVGITAQDKWISITTADINKDGFPDFFFGRSQSPGVFALSDGKARFRAVTAPRETTAATAAQFIDYDNDGLADLVTLTASGVHLCRNLGAEWQDVTNQTTKSTLHSNPVGQRLLQTRALASADFDNDGDTDLLLQEWEDDLMLLRNDGGNRNHSVKVDLRGHVSNRSAIQTKVEMRAGSLYQRLETSSASPASAPADVLFGLGKREQPDALRVTWPAGIIQAETEFPKPTGSFLRLNITELDRKPSSCPYLYTWNGERFEFITDFMGGGEMGYLEAPATGSGGPSYNQPDPIEYVRIRDDQLRPKDGRYELRVTNELEEAMFVDRLQLLAVTHPAGSEIFPNEGMSSPAKPFKLFMTRAAQPPLSAVDDHGNDVLPLIAEMDRRWPDDFGVDRIRGYAAEHSLTLTIPDFRFKIPNSKRVLLLNGWTDYAWSSDNVAAAHSEKVMKPPSLQVKDKQGKWQTVIDDIGIPVGRPQTVTVDLTDRFLSASREVRIVTNMRIYWDQILFASYVGTDRGSVTALDPLRADLRWRGYSAEGSSDGREPFGYEYERVSFVSPWKVMTGRYTREGDVRDLLFSSDDRFVVSRTGDEIALAFDAQALPAVPKGWRRTFLLFADGYSKEMDINSASPDQLAPMPFHGMTRYPYHAPERYPADAKHLEYLERYNTRVVRSQVPRIF